jgi:hypothetical protein
MACVVGTPCCCETTDAEEEGMMLMVDDRIVLAFHSDSFQAAFDE